MLILKITRKLVQNSEIPQTNRLYLVIIIITMLAHTPHIIIQRNSKWMHQRWATTFQQTMWTVQQPMIQDRIWILRSMIAMVT